MPLPPGIARRYLLAVQADLPASQGGTTSHSEVNSLLRREVPALYASRTPGYARRYVVLLTL